MWARLSGGGPDCLQDAALTQIAIERRLTLIALKPMNHWQPDGGFGLHVFHKNNELAGYCSVLHAMQLAGITGNYGLTNREVAAVGSPIPSTQIVPTPPRQDRLNTSPIPLLCATINAVTSH